jgi:hypothetical protein
VRGLLADELDRIGLAAGIEVCVDESRAGLPSVDDQGELLLVEAQPPRCLARLVAEAPGARACLGRREVIGVDRIRAWPSVIKWEVIFTDRQRSESVAERVSSKSR